MLYTVRKKNKKFFYNNLGIHGVIIYFYCMLIDLYYGFYENYLYNAFYIDCFL